MLTSAKQCAGLSLEKTNTCSDTKKLSQDLCEGIPGSSIDWYFAREYCKESMSKMGPNIINSFCNSSLGPKQWNCSIMNRVIRQ